MTPEQADHLLPVLVFVQAHLEGADLSAETLAHRAGLSPRHLHRLFTEALSETPQKYVERLRLERAAFYLRFQTDSILQIAMSVGFQSHEVFTRAFRRRFGKSPRELRKLASSDRSEGQGRRTLADSPRSALSNVSIVELAPQHVAFVRSTGPYESVDIDCWRRISEFIGARGLSSEGWLMGVGHDAPGVTASDQLRFDACVPVARPFRGEGHVGYQRLPGGPHARISHVGPLDALPTAYIEIAARLARLPGYRASWLPVLEVYHVRAIDDVHTLLQTDIHIPVERIVE